MFYEYIGQLDMIFHNSCCWYGSARKILVQLWYNSSGASTILVLLYYHYSDSGTILVLLLWCMTLCSYLTSLWRRQSGHTMPGSGHTSDAPPKPSFGSPVNYVGQPETLGL